MGPFWDTRNMFFFHWARRGVVLVSREVWKKTTFYFLCTLPSDKGCPLDIESWHDTIKGCPMDNVHWETIKTLVPWELPIKRIILAMSIVHWEFCIERCPVNNDSWYDNKCNTETKCLRSHRVWTCKRMVHIPDKTFEMKIPLIDF